MKTIVLLLSAAALSGCIAVPVYDPPGVYVAPVAPVVVVRPPTDYGYPWGYRHRWH